MAPEKSGAPGARFRIYDRQPPPWERPSERNAAKPSTNHFCSENGRNRTRTMRSQALRIGATKEMFKAASS